MNNKELFFKIIENWPAKVLSIALALILFTFNRLNTLTTRLLSVPLKVETSSMMIAASAYPQNIRVTLRGEDDSIMSIVDSDIEAFVDLTRYESGGVYSAPVQIRRKGSALGIEPLEIAVNPLEISVRLDRRISKLIPLTAAIRGRVAEGFDLVSFSLNPAEIVVVGPLSLLETVSEIQTEPIDLDGRNSNFNMETGIANPNPLFVVRGSGVADFSGFISPSVSVRSIESIPIVLIGLDPDFEADMGGRTGSIRIEGAQSEIDQFQPHPGFFTVDCTGITGPGTYSLPVKADLPAVFSLLRQEPENVSLTVTHNKKTEDQSGEEGPF